VTGSDWLQFVFAGLTLGSIYGIVGIGFSLIYNATGAINFAQGEFVVIGAFLTITLSHFVPLGFAIIAAAIGLALVGLIIEFAVVRRLRGDMLSLVIATVGISLAFRATALLVWGREPLGLRHFFGEKPIALFGASLLPQSLFILALAIVCLLGLEWFFAKTIHGKAMRAVVEDEDAARALGIHAERYTAFAFALAGLLASLAGSAVAPIAMLSYNAGGLLGLKGFAAAILGGLRKPRAALVGGLLLGLIEALAAGAFPSGYKDAIALFVLLVVLSVRPQGLFGAREERLV